MIIYNGVKIIREQFHYNEYIICIYEKKNEKRQTLSPFKYRKSRRKIEPEFGHLKNFVKRPLD